MKRRVMFIVFVMIFSIWCGGGCGGGGDDAGAGGNDDGGSNIDNGGDNNNGDSNVVDDVGENTVDNDDPEPSILIPDIPTGVEVVAADNTITVTWDDVTGATSYNIYWSTTAGVTKENGTEITDATSPYDHEDLTVGETYYYVETSEKPGHTSVTKFSG